MANQERDPRAYELMTVFIPDLTDEDSQAEIEKIEGLINAGGGTMTETLTASPWGRRRLAYTIRFNGVDYRDGIYTVFHFDMAPSALAELEREMKLDTNLMRYLLVHDDPKAGEQFGEGEQDGESEAEEPATTAEAGRSAGGATAAAAAQASANGTEAPVTETAASVPTEPAASEAPASAPAEPAESETAAPEATVPAAAQAAPVEEAAAPDTVTDTAPPATDDAASDSDTEKE